MVQAEDKRAPMAAAPIKYREDGEVDWGNMWDTFCVLAKDGGPRHRPTMLEPQEGSDVTTAAYLSVVAEITRGVQEVSGLAAQPAAPGWLAIQCESRGHARWLATATLEENVRARADGSLLLVPLGETFALKGEIKNVITAVAKTTHYWIEHVEPQIKRALVMEDRIASVKERVGRFFGR